MGGIAESCTSGSYTVLYVLNPVCIVNSCEIVINKGKKPREITMADTERPATSRRLSARKRRAMSAIPRPGTAATRPMTTPRRPYSAYTKREGDADAVPKYDGPESDREWWRFYMKVNQCCFELHNLVASM